MIFDGVRIRLLEIGEAVKAIPTEVTGREPDIPASQIARMRDNLAHRYFDTSHAIGQATVTNDLPELLDAVTRLIDPPDEKRTGATRFCREKCVRLRRDRLIALAERVPVGAPLTGLDSRAGLAGIDPRRAVQRDRCCGGIR